MAADVAEPGEHLGEALGEHLGPLDRGASPVLGHQRHGVAVRGYVRASSQMMTGDA